MTMENPPFEDVFPIEQWEFFIDMLVFRGVPGSSISFYCHHSSCDSKRSWKISHHKFEEADTLLDMFKDLKLDRFDMMKWSIGNHLLP